jgi:hypothetical protein
MTNGSALLRSKIHVGLGSGAEHSTSAALQLEKAHSPKEARGFVEAMDIASGWRPIPGLPICSVTFVLEGIDIAFMPPVRIACIPTIIAEPVESPMAKSAEGVSCVFGETIIMVRKIATTKATKVVRTNRRAKTSATPTFMTSASPMTPMSHRRRRGDDGRDCQGCSD